MKDLLLMAENEVSPLWWNIGLLAGSLLVGTFLKFILQKAFEFYVRRSHSFLLHSVIRNGRAPFNILLPLFTLNLCLPLMRLNDTQTPGKAMELSLLGAFAFLLIRIVKIAEEVINNKNDLTKADNLKARKIRTQIEFVSRIMIILIVLLTISAMLLSFDNLRKIGTGLIAGVGVGSIIIGFAAQSSLGNLLAGFQIAFTQPIRIDDVVVVEGEWGRIEDITLTYVVVKIWDERRLILPIRYFIEKPFQNWTRINADLIGTVFLYLDYSVPIDKVREEFKSLLNTSPLWDKRVNVIQVTDCKERTIELRALMSSRSSSDAFDLRCYIREGLIRFIQTNYPGSLPRIRAEVEQIPTHQN